MDFNWSAVLDCFEKQLSRQAYETWIKRTRLKAVDEVSGTLTIEAPNDFSREWLESKYSSLFKGILFDLTGRDYHVLFEVGDFSCNENSKPDEALGLGLNVNDLLLQFNNRADQLTQEIKSLRDDMKDFKSEVKALLSEMKDQER